MVDVDARWAEREEARLRLARLQASDESSLESSLDRALRISAVTLDVDRAGIWQLAEDGVELTCTRLVDLTAPEEQAGVVFRIPDIAAYQREIDAHRVVMIDDVASSPLLRAVVPEYYAAKGIAATLDAPIYRHGAIVGVVCLEHRGGARAWTASDATFAITMADVVASLTLGAELREAERGLRESELRLRDALADDALVRVARGVAHDLNNILAVIVTTADLLRRDPSPASLDRGVQAIREVAESGARLAQRLMTIGREQHGTRRTLPLDAAIQGRMGVLASVAGGDRSLTFTPGAGAANVRLDAALLEQLLLNLVTNAREATSEGGHVRIATSIEELAHPDGGRSDFAVIEVSDDGRGMSAPTLARCFEPFFSTKDAPREAGFGLATVQGVAQAAGGFVTAASEPGRGATFRVALPLAES